MRLKLVQKFVMKLSTVCHFEQREKSYNLRVGIRETPKVQFERVGRRDYEECATK